MRSTSMLLIALLTLAAGPACAPDAQVPQPASVLAGDWQLVSIASPNYNADVGPTPTPPVVRFRASRELEGTVGGTDGCNDWAGAYSVPAEGQVRIGPLASTLRQCIRVFTLAEGGYSGFELGSVTRFIRSGSELVLSSDDNATRLTFKQ